MVSKGHRQVQTQAVSLQKANVKDTMFAASVKTPLLRTYHGSLVRGFTSINPVNLLITIMTELLRTAKSLRLNPTGKLTN